MLLELFDSHYFCQRMRSYQGQEIIISHSFPAVIEFSTIHTHFSSHFLKFSKSFSLKIIKTTCELIHKVERFNDNLKFKAVVVKRRPDNSIKDRQRSFVYPFISSGALMIHTFLFGFY